MKEGAIDSAILAKKTNKNPLGENKYDQQLKNEDYNESIVQSSSPKVLEPAINIQQNSGAISGHKDVATQEGLKQSSTMNELFESIKLKRDSIQYNPEYVFNRAKRSYMVSFGQYVGFKRPY